MCTTHVLAIYDLTKTFIVEYDAPGHGIGAILLHERKSPCLRNQPT